MFLQNSLPTRIFLSFSHRVSQVFSPLCSLQMQFMLLFSRQGKLRLQKWYVPLSDKEKKKITRELVQTILARKPKMCSFLEWRDLKIVYKRWVWILCFVDEHRIENVTLAWAWTEGGREGVIERVKRKYYQRDTGIIMIATRAVFNFPSLWPAAVPMEGLADDWWTWVTHPRQTQHSSCSLVSNFALSKTHKRLFTS